MGVWAIRFPCARGFLTLFGLMVAGFVFDTPYHARHWRMAGDGRVRHACATFAFLTLACQLRPGGGRHGIFDLSPFVLLPRRAIVWYAGRMVKDYLVTLQEHDTTPWPAGSWPTKAGAWKRLRIAQRQSIGWPHLVIGRVYEISDTARPALIYKCDVRDLKSIS